jgi:hypothetical protein
MSARYYSELRHLFSFFTCINPYVLLVLAVSIASKRKYIHVCTPVLSGRELFQQSKQLDVRKCPLRAEVNRAAFFLSWSRAVTCIGMDMQRNNQLTKVSTSLHSLRKYSTVLWRIVVSSDHAQCRVSFFFTYLWDIRSCLHPIRICSFFRRSNTPSFLAALTRDALTQSES